MIAFQKEKVITKWEQLVSPKPQIYLEKQTRNILPLNLNTGFPTFRSSQSEAGVSPVSAGGEGEAQWGARGGHCNID